MELLDRSLGQLARKIPGATAIFHHYGLDFCCGGNKSLRRAAEEKNLDAAHLEQALFQLDTSGTTLVTETMSPGELIDYILENFHAVHRQQLPELIRLAEKVERVHGDKPDCPHGLTEHLMQMAQELEMHMQKEEQILFPMVKQGAGSMILGPVSVMRHEHDDHGAALRKLEQLTHGIQPPSGACNTWRALYLGLQRLRDDLMQHIHLENNLLFEKIEAQYPPVTKVNSCCGTCNHN